MKVSVDLCIVPIGVGVSVSKEIAICEKLIRESGLSSQLHAFGTNIEGDWDDVFKVIKQCHELLHQSGVVRLHSTLRVGTRTDKLQSLDDKIQKVEFLLKP